MKSNKSTLSFNPLRTSIAFGLVVLSIAFGTSCDSLLDVNAEGNITGDIYDTDENIKKALNGAYYNLGGTFDQIDGGELFGGDFIMIPTLIVAQKTSEISWSQIDPYNDFVDNDLLPTNLRIQSSWRRAYEVLNTVNNIIENIDNVTTDKNKVHGEALAIRGLLYFEMARFWGPEYESGTLTMETIPMLTKPINEVSQVKTPTLATLSAIYQQVETDLTSASTLLEPYGLNGTGLSYYACQATLMRMFMHKDEYDNALVHANNILGANAYELNDSPILAFNNKTNSSEDIFAIQQTPSSNAGDISTSTGIIHSFSSLEGMGIGAMRIVGAGFSSTSTLKNRPKFLPSDVREARDTEAHSGYTADSLTTGFYTNLENPGVYSPSKFSSSDRVIPIIRLAEIHLARAESIARETGVDQTAVDDLNAIRTRAGIVAVQLDDFNDGGVDEFIDSVKLEKKREFLYEGIIFHDLKRWDDPVGNSGLTGTSPELILPIPQSETDTWVN